MEIIRYDYYYGSHVSLQPTLHETVKEALRLPLNTMQIYLGSRQSARKKIGHQDVEKTRNLIEAHDLRLFFHSLLTHNLSGRKNYTGDSPEILNFINHVVTEMVHELETNDACGGDGVVAHWGFCENRNLGIDRVARTITEIIRKSRGGRLLMENSAGQGTSLGVMSEEWELLWSRLPRDVRKRVGWCIDTAHACAAGQFDMSTANGVKELFQVIDDLSGPGSIGAIHLNDSAKPRGSRVDRHALIGTGYLYESSKEGLLCLLEICRIRKIPIILETSPVIDTPRLHTLLSSINSSDQ